MKFRSLSLAVLLLILSLAPVKGQSQSEKMIPPAEISPTTGIGSVTATTADTSSPFSELFGEVRPIRKVALSFKVNGRLATVPYFSGAAVQASETIASLDPRDFDLNVAQAKGALEAAQAKLRQLESGSRPEEKRAAQENLKQSQANKENAQAEVERTRGLFKVGAVSQQVLDAAESKSKVTMAQFEALREQKAIVDIGPRIEDKEAARATIRQLESTVKLAELQKEYSSLMAPFPGLIAVRHLDEGAYVTSANPVYTIVQIDPVIITVDCPERMLPLLSPGLQATIAIDALPNLNFQGILERLPAVIDSKTRCATVEIFVPNPEGLLKPGMFARATFVPAEKK